ncbi:MAG: hypothetical protein OEW40_21790, partial [Cyclobacteriaceae bacterium]|nr:hypothetical protein [Cyclobacteriaceae bacterium]
GHDAADSLNANSTLEVSCNILKHKVVCVWISQGGYSNFLSKKHAQCHLSALHGSGLVRKFLAAMLNQDPII